MASVTYPTSYTNAQVGSVDIIDAACNAAPTIISFPVAYLGSHSLPQATGYPLATNIQRGYELKDDWQVGNPTFNTGCTGDAHAAFQRTIARIKAAHGDYVKIIQWTFIDDSNPASWKIAAPESLNTSTISDSELTWAVAQIHAAGLSARLQIQIQADTNGQTPATTQNNINLFLAAYGDYVVSRGQLAQALQIDAISLDCYGWTQFTGFESSYATQMVAIAQRLKQVYSGKLWAQMDNKLFADPNLINYVDYVIAMPYYNDVAAIAANIGTLSVGEIKSQLSNFFSWLNANAVPTKPIIVSVGVPSRADYFGSGYLEETFCTSSGSDPCVEKSKSTDFSLQAIVIEANLEKLSSQSSLNIGGFETDGYWLVDSVLPDTTFPNVAFSTRNKPAEALLDLWYKR
jgi:hypothetical protein